MFFEFDYTDLEMRIMEHYLKEQFMWQNVYSTPELTINGEARLVDEGRVVVQCGVQEGLPRIPLLPLEGQGQTEEG